MIKPPDERQPNLDEGAFQRSIANREDLPERIVEYGLLPPRPPIRFSVTDTGSGTRVTIVNDGPLSGRVNSATRFDVYWAEAVDTSSAAGKAAGFARATCLSPSIPATNVDHTESSGFYDDPKFASGYFYLVGVDRDGNRSEPTEPAQVTTGATDYSIPGDVRHLQVSESGEVAQNGSVMSYLSITASPPVDVSNFGGTQLYLGNFTRLGDVQEGYFHRYSGTGGINFKVPYPIPRRKGSASISLTNASTSVTGTGLLAIAQPNDQLEAFGRRITINAVTDTTITLASNWTGDTLTATVNDYCIIAYVTVYALAVSKAGTRRADSNNAPSVSVLMDGELSAPNYPASMSYANAGTAVRIMWEQIAGTHIDGYTVYRSDTFDSGMTSVPPRPGSGTKMLGSYTQNPNLRSGGTNTNLQYDDTNFDKYQLETNATFYYYVTTTNVRGDESAANYLSSVPCRQAGMFEIDPTIPARNPGKNYLYNGALYGLAGNTVLANDTTQDDYMGTDASNLPGRNYGDAAGQANGTGKFRGYCRWGSGDGGGGASGSAPTFQNNGEIHITPSGSGAGKVWYVNQEIGAWDEASAPFRKIAKGEVYTLSVHLSRTSGGGATDGTFYFYLDQYDNNTFKDESKRRYRASDGTIATTAAHLNIAGSEITTTAIRYQASFQMDSALSPTKQIRVNFAWEQGTTGVVVISRAQLNPGDTAALWTPDMGDPNISIPSTTPIDPLNDRVSERVGDAKRYEP